MIPSMGRIVYYTLDNSDAQSITGQRERVEAFSGTGVNAGSVFPMLITRTWGDTEGSAVNGQVFLDGNDSLWVTSRVQGTSQRNWFVPPRVSAPAPEPVQATPQGSPGEPPEAPDSTVTDGQGSALAEPEGTTAPQPTPVAEPAPPIT